MILQRLKAFIHRLSTRGIRGDNEGDILANVHLRYIQDIHSKRATGVMIRLPNEVYRERREFKIWLSLQILYYERLLNRRKQNA
jgi:hypothetical protein